MSTGLLNVLRYEGIATIPTNLLTNVVGLRRRHLWEPEGLTEQDYSQSDARNVHLIATLEPERVFGYVQYDPSSNRLRQLIVPREARVQGVGRLVVEHVCQEGLLPCPVHLTDRRGS